MDKFNEIEETGGTGPLFTNKCTHTKNNHIEINIRTSLSKSRTIIMICMGLISFSTGLLTKNNSSCMIGFFLCVFPLLLLMMVRHTSSLGYKQQQQLFNRDVEVITSFYENHFIVHNLTNVSDVKINYQKVARVVETKNLFYLMLSTGIGFMVDKQGFAGTTARP